MTLRAPLILAVLLPLAACAKPMADLPSLAIRDVERVTGQLQPVSPPYVAPAPSAYVLDEVSSLLKDATDANARFTHSLGTARSAVRSGSGTSAGNESWARAQVALSGLQAERSQAMVALARLDRLYIDAALDNADLSRLESARQEIAGQIDAQSAIISQLTTELAR